MAALGRSGAKLSPVVVEGRQITATFWGKAWCQNLERYSDFANRLPRGRSYVRHGAVIDLQIDSRHVAARVSGSDIYRVEVSVSAVPACGGRPSAGTVPARSIRSSHCCKESCQTGRCRGSATGRRTVPSPRELRSAAAVRIARRSANTRGRAVRHRRPPDREPELLFMLRKVINRISSPRLAPLWSGEPDGRGMRACSRPISPRCSASRSLMPSRRR